MGVKIILKTNLTDFSNKYGFSKENSVKRKKTNPCRKYGGKRKEIYRKFSVPPNKPSDKTGLSTYIDCTKPERWKYISEMTIHIAIYKWVRFV